MNTTEKRAVVIGGPTATGKTALGVALAGAIGGEIISADSMQIYRGMDIGTAKVTPREAQGVPHHMVDIVSPGESFSVSAWVDMAAAAAEDIFSRGKTPIIVGGTGLYVDSLLSGRVFAESGADTGLREELGEEYDRIGGEAFREKLRAVDPDRAEKLHPSDKKRLVRALEIFTLTGRTITEHDRQSRSLPPRWPSVRFALGFEDREKLYARIDRRVDLMVEQGLFEEVRALLASGLSSHSTAMQAIGYKEVVRHFSGELSREEAIQLIKLSSRRYAKRQLTWLRRDRELVWIMRDAVPDTADALKIVLDTLAR